MNQQHHHKPIGSIEPEKFQGEERHLYHLGSERAFLATLIQKPNLIVGAQAKVQPEELHWEAHRYIYQVMLWIYTNATTGNWAISFDPPSLLMAADRCVAMGDPTAKDRFLAKTDGMRLVNEIADHADAVNAAGFDNYIATIKDRHVRVLAYRRARELQQKLLDLEASPNAEEVVQTVGNEMTCSTPTSGDADGYGSIIRLSDKREQIGREAWMAHHYGGDKIFYNTVPGFPFWNKLMGGGFRRKGLNVIAARAKTGKTTLLMHLASEFTKLGHPVLYIDNEMSAVELATRQISNLSRVAEHDILMGRIFDDGNQMAYGAVQDAMDVMNDQMFYYINVAGQPAQRVASAMREFHYKAVETFELADAHGKMHRFSKAALVIFDWLKLPDSTSLNDMSETQSLGFLCSTIKDTAARLDLPVIAGAQNNREAVGRDPEDFIDEPERMIAGSDRIAFFCTQLCILRNVSRLETERLKGAGYDQCRLPDGTLLPPTGDSHKVPLERADPVDLGLPAGKEDERNALLFNQFLHVTLLRGGSDYRQGFPLFINRGRALYEEVSPENGQTSWDELNYIREKVLRRSSAKGKSQEGPMK